MAKKPDGILIGVIAILVVFGLLILASVSAPYALERFGNTYYFLKHQIIFGLIPGLIFAFILYRINLSFLKKWAPALLLLNLVLMVMVFLPVIGTELEGAHRWVGLGPISFQPSEFLKLTSILYFATWLSARTGKSNSTKKEFSQTFIAFLIAIGIISMLLIFQPDISTLGIIAAVATLMYFLSGTVLWHSLFIILIGAGGLLTLIKLAPYRWNRLLVFLNPELDPMGRGYQIKQALISIGAGGFTGVGLGMSSQRLGSLPQVISDSIFAIFSEETGFIGGFFLISLFLIFLWRGFKIARRAQDKFLQLTALGITSWICLQTFVNIGSMTGLLPLSGIPLPFISYGGTALAIELAATGILLNISKQHQ